MTVEDANRRLRRLLGLTQEQAAYIGRLDPRRLRDDPRYPDSEKSILMGSVDVHKAAYAKGKYS